MSSRRARISRNTDDEINDLISKLQELLPDSSSGKCHTKVSAAKIIKETSKYLKKLHREVDELSERVAQLLASGAITSIDADTIRTLIQH